MENFNKLKKQIRCPMGIKRICGIGVSGKNEFPANEVISPERSLRLVVK